MAVERLAIVIAAAVGHYWLGIDDETRSNYRVMANQALFFLGIEAHVRGLARTRHAIEDMAATMRRAADKLEEAKIDEMTIRRLHVGASNCDAILMVLDAAPEELSDDSGKLEEAI
jgi:hypothetical protein